MGIGIGCGYSATTPPALKWFPPAKTGLIAGLVVVTFMPQWTILDPLMAMAVGALQSVINYGMMAFNPTFLIRTYHLSLGETALKKAFELPIAWTDAWGKQHPTTQEGRSRSTPCAAWRRIPTAFRQCVRWPC